MRDPINIKVVLRQPSTNDKQRIKEILTSTDTNEFLNSEFDAERLSTLISMGGIMEENNYYYATLIQADIIKTSRLSGKIATASVIAGVITVTYSKDYTNTLNIFYAVDKDYRALGICTEAMKALLEDIPTGYLPVSRIQLIISDGNIASMKVAEHLDFKLEGLAKKCMIIGGEATDCYIYSKVYDKPLPAKLIDRQEQQEQKQPQKQQSKQSPPREHQSKQQPSSNNSNVRRVESESLVEDLDEDESVVSRYIANRRSHSEQEQQEGHRDQQEERQVHKQMQVQVQDRIHGQIQDQVQESSVNKRIVNITEDEIEVDRIKQINNTNKIPTATSPMAAQTQKYDVSDELNETSNNEVTNTVSESISPGRSKLKAAVQILDEINSDTKEEVAVSENNFESLNDRNNVNQSFGKMLSEMLRSIDDTEDEDFDDGVVEEDIKSEAESEIIKETTEIETLDGVEDEIINKSVDDESIDELVDGNSTEDKDVIENGDTIEALLQVDENISEDSDEEPDITVHDEDKEQVNTDEDNVTETAVNKNTNRVSDERRYPNEYPEDVFRILETDLDEDVEDTEYEDYDEALELSESADDESEYIDYDDSGNYEQPDEQPEVDSYADIENQNQVEQDQDDINVSQPEELIQDTDSNSRSASEDEPEEIQPAVVQPLRLKGLTKNKIKR